MQGDLGPLCPLVKERVLLVIAGEIVVCDSGKLVHFLVLGRDHHFLVDYLLCLFEELDCLLKLN